MIDGEGVYDDIPYCGIKKVPKGRKRGTMAECAELGKVMYYGVEKIDPAILAASVTAEERKRKQKRKQTLYYRAQVMKKKYDAAIEASEDAKDDADRKKQKKKADDYRATYIKTVAEFKKLKDEIDNNLSNKPNDDKSAKRDDKQNDIDITKLIKMQTKHKTKQDKSLAKTEAEHDEIAKIFEKPEDELSTMNKQATTLFHRANALKKAYEIASDAGDDTKAEATREQYRKTVAEFKALKTAIANYGQGGKITHDDIMKMIAK